VKEVVEAGGMHAVDAGPLRRAQQLGSLHMTLQDDLDGGYDSTVKFVTPSGCARR
jgi:predicted dinucleotide-binding enzyme